MPSMELLALEDAFEQFLRRSLCRKQSPEAEAQKANILSHLKVKQGKLCSNNAGDPACKVIKALQERVVQVQNGSVSCREPDSYGQCEDWAHFWLANCPACDNMNDYLEDLSPVEWQTSMQDSCFESNEL
eukprot:gnl/TRDRNA2_/TRDRNA2_168097_c2_seq1.p1 gnl/TRDRNA2_/TRDRNA2_168097_c2~~gnl/TRDRNA2_/TRDRNA2_168097_c2_seq1.p1  ORF type:complete len:130 (+),score=13.23 gnl/TRDRNA2_/TRDRNA2_168097_c2_seq1:1-390(+)